MRIPLLSIVLTHLVFSLPIRANDAPPAPFGAIPHERQVAWQRLEYYGFIHFGLNTFTDREWGYGDEDPSLFNPKYFDVPAIVRHFKNAGMKGIIVTAKHHDGFCLWPTKTTEHNITKSPWKNGKGDILREFADACLAEKMKLGIYVSPWDRNHPEYARDGYVNVFHEQIREVLSNYGPVFEIWFDGANGGNGYYGGTKENRSIAKDYYQFPKALEMIRKLQPNCVVWGAGDARWGGSEQGHVAYPHWHTMDSIQSRKDLATGVRHGELWQPAEGDTSIRPGWFWHELQDSKVKSPEKLLQVWFDCVGRGANLILNVPPDRDGRIREVDVQSLMGFRKLRDALYSNDFAAAATASGPSRGDDKSYAPANLTDSDMDSYWTPHDGIATPSAEIRLRSPATFDVIRLREQIHLGQRVDTFAIDVWSNDNWKEIHTGQTIGYQLLARLSQSVTTDRLRLRITQSAAPPCISEISLFKMPITQKCQTETILSEQNSLKKNWKIANATAGTPTHAIDSDPATLWKTPETSDKNAPPQSFEVDMGSTQHITAMTYLPRQDGSPNGMTEHYRFELSRDSKHWENVSEGSFSNIRANPIEQIMALKKPISARYFRFTALRALEKNHMSAAEVGVIAAP